MEMSKYVIGLSDSEAIRVLLKIREAGDVGALIWARGYLRLVALSDIAATLGTAKMIEGARTN